MTRLDEPVAATIGVVDGRVAMSADGEATVYVDQPRCQPLTRGETYATLRVEGDGYRAALELDADALAALTAALEDAQAWEGDQ